MHRSSIIQPQLRAITLSRRSLSSTQSFPILEYLASIPTSNLRHSAIQPHPLSSDHKRLNRPGPPYTHTFPTPETLSSSIASNFPKQAWAIYKHLATASFTASHFHTPDIVDAETHTLLLQQTTRFPIYLDAAVKADKILTNMLNQDSPTHPLDDRDILALLKIHYRNDNDTARILHVFGLARTPTTAHYTVLIMSLGRRGLLESCVYYYTQMCEKNGGAKYDTGVLSALIDAFGFAAQIDGGVEVFSGYLDAVKEVQDGEEFQMREDVGVCEAMIRCYGRCGYLDDAIDLFESLRCGSVENVTVERTTYDAIIEAVACSGTFDECKHYRKLMNEWCVDQTIGVETCRSDTKSSAVGKAGRATRIKHAHRRHQSAYMTYSRDALMPLYQADTKAAIELSFNFLQKGPGENLATHIEYPLMHTFESMLCSAIRSMRSDCENKATIEDVMEIFLSCQRGYSVPSQGVYGAVIEALTVAGRSIEADEWRQGMTSKGYLFDIGVNKELVD